MPSLLSLPFDLIHELLEWLCLSEWAKIDRAVSGELRHGFLDVLCKTKVHSGVPFIYLQRCWNCYDWVVGRNIGITKLAFDGRTRIPNSLNFNVITSLCCGISSFDQAIAMINKCPSLTYLYLMDVNIPPSGATLVNFQLFSNLKVLLLDHCDGLIDSWLSSALIHCTKVEVFELSKYDGLGGSQLHLDCQMLPKQTLRELYLLNCFSDPQECLTHLSECKLIEKVTIRHSSYFHDDGTFELVHKVCSISTLKEFHLCDSISYRRERIVGSGPVLTLRSYHYVEVFELLKSLKIEELQLVKFKIAIVNTLLTVSAHYFHHLTALHLNRLENHTDTEVRHFLTEYVINVNMLWISEYDDKSINNIAIPLLTRWKILTLSRSVLQQKTIKYIVAQAVANDIMLTFKGCSMLEKNMSESDSVNFSNIDTYVKSLSTNVIVKE